MTQEETTTKTQREMVLEHLKAHGSITDLEAYRDYGIRRLSGIIHLLRHNEHVNIETEDTKEKNRFGKEVTFAKYVYKGEQLIIALCCVYTGNSAAEYI